MMTIPVWGQHNIPQTNINPIKMGWSPWFMIIIFLEAYVLKRMLRNFTNLEKLDLYHVNMSNVPLDHNFFANASLSLMFLGLTHCELRGKFPENVFRLPNLQYLDLWNNNDLSGSLPTFNWSTPLRHLVLSHTKISVDFSFLCTRAKSLQVLSLRNCSFIGTPYPAMLTNLTQLVQLTSLSLHFNNFGGQIPLFYLNLQQLIELDLSGNNFVGEIPQILETKNSTLPNNLEILNFSENLLNLRSNMIQGNLPNVPLSLQVFFISNNHLYGEIPSSYCNLSKIYILDLSNNSIQGKIPSCLGNKSYLSVLDLDMNEL
ncbi:hypothetical protein G4B88_016520, partial [Cannabis sativa]